MTVPHGNSPSKYHDLFSQKPSHVGNIKILISISSIFEYDYIDRLENNQWRCLWSNVKFQGINATKDLGHLIGTKCMHIKRCTASINQARE